MRPRFSVNKSGQCYLFYSKFRSQGGLGYIANAIAASNLNNVSLLEFGFPLPLPARHKRWVDVARMVVPFVHPALGIYTSSVVAMMTDTFSFRNRAAVKNPRSPVSQHNLRRASAGSDVSVSSSINVRSPDPAWTKFWSVRWNRAAFVDLIPESFRKCYGKSLREKVARSNCNLHSVRLVDCLPGLRVLVHRAGYFLDAFPRLFV